MIVVTIVMVTVIDMVMTDGIETGIETDMGGMINITMVLKELNHNLKAHVRF